MSKLWASGCSYTNFEWPSYADWLAPGWDEFENLGSGGAGNRYIFQRIGYLISKNFIKSEDTVLVQWSAIAREDRVLTGNAGWSTAGNIHYQDIYPEEWVKKYFNIIQTSAELISNFNVLELALKQIGCQYIFLNMFDWEVDKFLGEPATPASVHDQIQQWESMGYRKALKKLSERCLRPCIEEFKWDYCEEKHYVKYHNSLKAQWDNHPNSYAHYQYAHKVIKPHLKVPYLKELEKKEYYDSAVKWTEYHKDWDKVNQTDKDPFPPTYVEDLKYPSEGCLAQHDTLDYTNNKRHMKYIKPNE
jgi:hypothetical protein